MFHSLPLTYSKFLILCCSNIIGQTIFGYEKVMLLQWTKFNWILTDILRVEERKKSKRVNTNCLYFLKFFMDPDEIFDNITSPSIYDSTTFYKFKSNLKASISHCEYFTPCRFFYIFESILLYTYTASAQFQRLDIINVTLRVKEKKKEKQKKN